MMHPLTSVAQVFGQTLSQPTGLKRLPELGKKRCKINTFNFSAADVWVKPIEVVPKGNNPVDFKT